MDVADFLPIISAAAVGSLAVAREALQVRGTRTTLKQDLEILAMLPPESAIRDRLQEDIEARITDLINRERRRDLFGIVLGLCFVVTGLPFLVRAADVGGIGWWSFGSALVVVGMAGGASSASRTERDEAGRRLDLKQRRRSTPSHLDPTGSNPSRRTGHQQDTEPPESA